VDGACAALPVIAALFCAEHLEILAQGVEESDPRLKHELVVFAVDAQSDGNRAGNSAGCLGLVRRLGLVYSGGVSDGSGARREPGCAKLAKERSPGKSAEDGSVRFRGHIGGGIARFLHSLTPMVRCLRQGSMCGGTRFKEAENVATASVKRYSRARAESRKLDIF
jgi:hypothetical protein